MSAAARELRVRGKQVDYSDFYTPEDAKKRRTAAHSSEDDDDDDDDVLLPLKLSKTAAAPAATAAAKHKTKEKAKEPAKKKISSSATTAAVVREGKKMKKRAHDDDEDEDDSVFEKKAKKVNAKKSENDAKDKPNEAAAVNVKKKKKKKAEAAEPKEKPAAKEKERKREASETSNGTTKYAPAKKSLSLAKPAAPASMPLSDAASGSDVTALRKKYEALKQLRETESERLLQDARVLALEEKKTYERMISKLKKEVSTLSSRLQDDQIKREKEIEQLQTENQLRLESLERKFADSNSDSQRRRIKELETQLNEARKHTKANGKAAASRSGSKAVEENLQLAQATKLLEIYRLVTSTEIQLIETLDEDEDASYTDVSCTAVDSNTGKQFHFDLGVPDDEDDEIEYLPSETPNSDFKTPSYLQDELSFKRSEMTKFMRTILDIVIRKKADARATR